MSAACSHATSTKASISGKFASFCGLGLPATTVYDLRPDLAMSSRRRAMAVRYPATPSVPATMPTTRASRAFSMEICDV